jgi:DNA primase
VIDALSANAAGYRGVAVLGPARADAETASRLARLDGRLVLALDADPAGNDATARLARHLTAIGRRPTVLRLADGDLNDALVAASNWPRKLAAHVDRATAAAQSGPSLAR